MWANSKSSIGLDRKLRSHRSTGDLNKLAAARGDDPYDGLLSSRPGVSRVVSDTDAYSSSGYLSRCIIRVMAGEVPESSPSPASGCLLQRRKDRDRSTHLPHRQNLASKRCSEAFSNVKEVRTTMYDRFTERRLHLRLCAIVPGKLILLHHLYNNMHVQTDNYTRSGYGGEYIRAQKLSGDEVGLCYGYVIYESGFEPAVASNVRGHGFCVAFYYSDDLAPVCHSATRWMVCKCDCQPHAWHVLTMTLTVRRCILLRSLGTKDLESQNIPDHVELSGRQRILHHEGVHAGEDEGWDASR